LAQTGKTREELVAIPVFGDIHFHVLYVATGLHVQTKPRHIFVTAEVADPDRGTSRSAASLEEQPSLPARETGHGSRRCRQPLPDHAQRGHHAAQHHHAEQDHH
jgi:hypothetical protein